MTGTAQAEPWPCSYGSAHHDLVTWANTYVEANRRGIGLEDYWSIAVRVLCPFPERKITYEGKITWDSEVWFATIDLVCTLPGSLYEWVLTHELFELKYWRTGDAFQSLVGQMAFSKMRALYARRYAEARNQEIELAVGHYLSSRRPAHVFDEGEIHDLSRKLRTWGIDTSVGEAHSDEEEENPYPDILTITIDDEKEEEEQEGGNI